jgi:hypothetical protein
MRNDLAAAVEGFTQRKVVAFMSANHVAPDLAAEIFVLDEAVNETAEFSVPREDRGQAEAGQDGAAQTAESR